MNIIVILDTVLRLVSSNMIFRKLVVFSDLDKALADPAARVGSMDGGPPNVEKLKFLLGPFLPDSFHLTEGSILDPCYEIWE